MGANLTDGFEHYYRAGAERVESAFENGLIILDTNILLNVLRFSPSAREELVGVLESVASRTRVPYQIAVEYNRNRVRVVTERKKELSAASNEIDEIRQSARSLFRRLRDRRFLHGEEILKLENSIDSFVRALEDASASALGQYDLDPASLVGEIDPFTHRLSQAFSGRVAERPNDELREEDLREATRRREAKIAPGFKDEAGGDYLWWAEVLRMPELSGKPLVIVSDDVAKGDWLFEEHGISVGPQAVLYEDVRKAGGTDLVLLTTRGLLEITERIGFSQVSEATIEESEKVLAKGGVAWPQAAYVELLRLLDLKGYETRVRVIRAAAFEGGYLDREAVYHIAGLDEADRSLRQFATPVQRLSTQLQDDGILPDGVTNALKAEYSGPGKAIGYSVPWEFNSFERRDRNLNEGDEAEG